MKTSVVFVDETHASLRQLEQLTASMTDQWDMRFFGDRERALTFVRTHAVDVVVADLTMPGWSGPDFLALVSEVQPSCARVLLAEFEDEDKVFGSTRVAHQFLPKPCDVRELAKMIQRLEKASMPTEPAVIRDLVGGIRELPALGRVYMELVEEIESDSSSSESLGAIVSKDIALTAQLMRLVNSSYFGLSAEITSVAHAISFLGFDVVRAIVIGHALFDGEADPIIDLVAVATRARLVAGLARLGVQRNGGSAVESAEAFLAGMLHEVGLLVLSRLDTERTRLRSILGRNELRVERVEFAADRFDVGAHLLTLWGFTPHLTEAVAGLSDNRPDTTTELGCALLLARRVADSPVDLARELTREELSLLLDVAKSDELDDFDWKTNAA